MKLRLVQLSHPTNGRRVAAVEEPRLHVVKGFDSVYELAEASINSGKRIADLIGTSRGDVLDYDAIYSGRDAWKLLPPFDHPSEPTRCYITGTGLTHKASADSRQSMHGPAETITDSMKMFRMGLEGGRPDPHCIGAQPEWFYKGTGHILRAQNDPLDVPAHADDGGEESEIAGIYLIGKDGTPHRVGMAQANEFSDHVLEAENYLYLAASKLRSCALGPELTIDANFDDIRGQASIERAGKTIWSAPLASGEKSMCHSLANLEHHHFKHESHRRAGDVHIHFFGADRFSFKEKLKLEDGDVMSVAYAGVGRPLRNPIRIDRAPQKLVAVKGLA